MKCYLKTCLFVYVSVLLCNTCFAKKHAANDFVLTIHKWTLVEITQKENDTLTNLTLFLTPCEKDNYIEFSSDNTYKIHEGPQKCTGSDNDIKGEGTWSFSQPDSTILDSYEGGKKIPKRVLTLNDEILKIQYYGEGRKLFTLTYFSEEGKKDETNKDLIVDNSDASQNITQVIRNYLESTNRYIITPAKNFQNAIRSGEDNKNGLKPTVVIMPFTNASKEPVNSAERNSQLIAQAKKSGVDYVITGNLINAESKTDEKNNYVGSVKFDLFVLEVASGFTFAQTISDKDEVKKPEEKKKSGFLSGVGEVVRGVTAGTFAVLNTLAYGGNLNQNYNKTYNSLFKADRAMSTAASTATVFTSGNDAARNQTYNQNNATIQAVSKTTDNVIAFVAEHAAIKIKISNIEGSGKNAKVIIGAGTNISLEKDERLNVLKVSTITVGNSTTPHNQKLGEIEVKDFIGDIASSCTIENGKDDILKAFKESPNDIIVVTKLKTSKKK